MPVELARILRAGVLATSAWWCQETTVRRLKEHCAISSGLRPSTAALTRSTLNDNPVIRCCTISHNHFHRQTGVRTVVIDQPPEGCAIRESEVFTHACMDIDIRRIDQARLAFDWMASRNPYEYREAEGLPGIYMATITRQTGSPEMRWYYKVTEEADGRYVDLLLLRVVSEDPDDPI